VSADCTKASTQWRPKATLPTLKQSAKLRHAIHEWMQAQEILEVCTPALSIAGTTDPHIDSLVVPAAGGCEGNRYLHTSPEFAMKRILCAYPSQDIYQIAAVFRAEEQGRFHVSQFSMLEWYRTGMDHHSLMQDVEKLLRHIWNAFDLEFPGVDLRSYSQNVYDKLGQWPDKLDALVVSQYFEKHERSFPKGLESDLSACVDLFMDEFVLPEFDENRVTFLYEYPASQAALSRIGKGISGEAVAERFEVYMGQVELANGFHELADATAQRQRFEQDVLARQMRGRQEVSMDENLLKALSNGLPDCAGIALGVDRLHMVLGSHSHISQVLTFSDDNA